MPPPLPPAQENGFPCTGCGACCKVISWADEIIVRDDPEHPYYFPYTHKEGVCEKLGEDNRCTIYETRPLICRIEESCEYFGRDKQKYFELNIKGCHEIIDKLGMDEKWKPKL